MKSFILTNGCFDILSWHHVSFLEACKALGETLWVYVNSDESVRRLKGDQRPLIPIKERMGMVKALRCVQNVVAFEGDMSSIFGMPHFQRAKGCIDLIWAKGADYTMGTLDPREKEAALAAGFEIVLVPKVEHESTTQLIKRIQSLPHD